MSTLTGSITYKGQRLSARIIQDHVCISTSGLARVLSRDPGRLRSVLSRVRRDTPAACVPGLDVHRVGGETWWAPHAVDVLAGYLSSPADEMAAQLADHIVNGPQLEFDQPPAEPAQESPAPAADPPG